MQYTELELNKLIQDVEKEFTTHLAKAEEEFNSSKLAKAEGDEKKPEAKEDKPAEKHAEKPAAEDKKEAPPAAEGKKEEAPKADAPPAEGEKKEAPPAAEGEKPPAAEGEKPAAAAPAEDCDYDDEDHAHMHEMYSSMSKGELKAHHDAVRKALDAQGMQKCGDMHMAKSEAEVSVTIKPEQVAQPNPETELLKSELQAKETKLAEMQKSVDVMTEFLTKLFAKKSAPAGKAITNLEVVAKSEGGQEVKPLNKTEITAKLLKQAANPTLAKSDRDAITAYYTSGQVNVQSISHLL